LVTDSGTGTRILSALSGGNKTVTQLLTAITTPSGKKTKRHQLKHWCDYLEANGSITKASGTKWHNASWEKE